jgi:hypothetical protein
MLNSCFSESWRSKDLWQVLSFCKVGSQHFEFWAWNLETETRDDWNDLAFDVYVGAFVCWRDVWTCFFKIPWFSWGFQEIFLLMIESSILLWPLVGENLILFSSWSNNWNWTCFEEHFQFKLAQAAEFLMFIKKRIKFFNNKRTFQLIVNYQ